jgi:hypothetical protein
MTDLIYGPQTPAVQALISRASRLTPDETTRLAAAWDIAAVAARSIARNVVRAAAQDATRYDAWALAGDAAWKATGTMAGAVVIDTAFALVVRDLIPDDAYRTLTGPWAEVIGPAHPNDLTPETPHACLPS